MTREEAIKVIKANYPDSRYTMLREAVDAAIEALSISLPEGLEEAAEEYCTKCRENCYHLSPYSAFKAGAKWMAGQGYSQEEIVEDKSIEVGYGVLPGITPIINLPDSFKPGDKVIVQIRKK